MRFVAYTVAVVAIGLQGCCKSTKKDGHEAKYVKDGESYAVKLKCKGDKKDKDITEKINAALKADKKKAIGKKCPSGEDAQKKAVEKYIKDQCKDGDKDGDNSEDEEGEEENDD